MLIQASALIEAVQFKAGQPLFADGEVSGSDGSAGGFARLFDSSGASTFGDDLALDSIIVDRSAVNRALQGESVTRRIKFGGDDDWIRVKTQPIFEDQKIAGVLEFGLSEEDISDTLYLLLVIMGLAYPVVLVGAIVGGSILASRALSPIDRITSAARRISSEDLHQRLNLSLPNDEVGRLARTFDEMLARLDAAFQRQRQFTADASHDLRTPLTILKGQIEVSFQKKRTPEDYRQVLRAMSEEVDRLIRLTGDLLTLTRAESGQLGLIFEDLDVAETLNGVVEQVRSSAAIKGVDIRLDPGPQLSVSADQDALLQLLLNLLDNAIKYTPPGGQVVVGWQRYGDQVEIRVRDTGIGISEEHLSQVFDRFYRVDPARNRVQGGSGLGLAISKWIVEAHGGSVSVESSPNAGSTFIVLLPLSPKSLEATGRV